MFYVYDFREIGQRRKCNAMIKYRVTHWKRYTFFSSFLEVQGCVWGTWHFREKHAFEFHRYEADFDDGGRRTAEISHQYYIRVPNDGSYIGSTATYGSSVGLPACLPA